MTRAKGIDTSRYNHYRTGSDLFEPIDWWRVYSHGYEFAAHRMTIGNYYIDPAWREDFEAASATPMIQLGYHVLRPNLDTASQVSKIWEALGLVSGLPSAIVLDLELGQELGAAAVRKCYREHVDQIRAQVGNIKLILYTNLNYLSLLGGDTYGLPLWLAWPGPGNGYNNEPEPPIKPWLIWQKSWKQDVPGVPKPENDLNEFNGTTDDLFYYFGVVDTPGDDPPVTIDYTPVLTRIADALEAGNELLDELITAVLGADTPGDPDPEPELEYINVRVTKDPRANAFCIKGWNDAPPENGGPFPIMQIYPNDSAPVSERIQFNAGTIVAVFPDKMRADGGGMFWEITDWPSTDVILYLREQDVTRAA